MRQKFDSFPKERLHPTLESFAKRAAAGEKIIPVYTEIFTGNEIPASALDKLGETPHSFILESVEGSDQVARYSFVSNDPYLIFQAHGSQVKLGKSHSTSGYPNKITHWEEKQHEKPIEQLRDLLDQYASGANGNLPRFFGGAVGYMGFNSVQYFEPVLAGTFPVDEGIPDISMMFTRSVLIFDHLKGVLKIVVNAMPGEHPDNAYHQATQIIISIMGRLKKSGSNNSAPMADIPIKQPDISSNVTKNSFCSAVKEAKKYILQGEIFQAVLSQRFSTAADFDPLTLLHCLKAVNPSPYMFYIKFNELCLVGASPEMMVRLEAGEAQIRPIAGTRKRGKDCHEDALLAEDLIKDEKEQAEHLMLVDLGRNDLGRVCQFGSVTVEEYSQVEHFSHVMHLVSRVKGKLHPDMDALDSLAASFPAGTVSGAPKIRAIEIINQLEGTPRGPYAGIVGYLGYNGQMDTCINIRSVTINNGRAYIQTGAGIVADSHPENEYQETINKAEAMFQAVAMAKGGGEKI